MPRLGPAPGPPRAGRLRLRGLVGRGVVRSSPYLAVDPVHPGTVSTYVLVEWDRLVPVDERIPLHVLETEVPGLTWAETYASATAVPAPMAADLDALWERPRVPAGAGGLSSPLDLLSGMLYAVLHATPLIRR